MGLWVFAPVQKFWIASAAAFAVLLMGSVATWVIGRLSPGVDIGNLRQRVRTWWWIVPLLSGVLALGSGAVALLFGVVSALALREYEALAESERYADVRVWRAVLVVSLLAQFYLSYRGSFPAFGLSIPACAVLLILFSRRERYCAGGLLLVYALSHIPRLATLPEGANWVAFLLVVTQVNDVAQYVWGKRFGRTPLAPRLSPNKTREGLYGGLVTSGILAAWLGGVILPVDFWQAGLAGIGLAVLGVAGDLTISALKRRARVKDAGSLLPGHGGVLDRVDGLLYASPALFYAVHAGVI